MHSCLVTWPCYFGYGRLSFAYMYFVNMRWQTVRVNELLVTIFIHVPISVAVFKVCTMLHTLFTWYVSFGLGVLLVCVYGCHYLQQRWPILPIFVYLLFLRVGLSHYLGKRFVPNTPDHFSPCGMHIRGGTIVFSDPIHVRCLKSGVHRE